MIDYIVYGKIIIDAIKLLDGRIVQDVLGGGGPQGAFGARLWSDSVGLLTRSGTDIPQSASNILKNMDIDLSGWMQYPDLTTTRGAMVYDENQYLSSSVELKVDMGRLVANIEQFISRPITLPAHYNHPKAIHLITEFSNEKMMQTALHLRRNGSLLSLEPLIDYREWKNKDEIIALLPQVDIVTPDWPSASGIAGSDDPKKVLGYWSTLGSEFVSVRHGQYGSYTWDRTNRKSWHVPPVPIDVVDPTGAGNAYGGGLCVGWEKTHDARLAGCYGAVSAAFLVNSVGVPSRNSGLAFETQRLLDIAIKLSHPL